MFFDDIFKCPYCREAVSNRVSCKWCAEKLVELINFKKLKTANCDEITAPFVYDYLVRDAILDFKFRDRLDNCESFAFFMKNCDFLRADMVVGVPCFKNRKKFKKMKQLVLAFSRAAGLKCSFSLIRKIRQTKLQHECSLRQRLINLNGAFEASSWKVKNRSILICDDIVTSASTIDEMARVLKKAGALKVGAISIAISKIVLKQGLAKLV